jgi:hypothetical protein
MNALLLIVDRLSVVRTRKCRAGPARHAVAMAGLSTSLDKEKEMSFTNIKLIENVFGADHHGEVVRLLTDVTVAVEGEHIRSVT